MKSIHIPSSFVSRLARWGLAIMPPLSVVFSSLALGVRWIGDRASLEEVGKAVEPALSAAKAAQADAHHCASTLKEINPQIARAWAEVVALHAELEVYRRYGTAVSKDGHRRGELIADATRFFGGEFESQLESHPNNPSEAARRALLARWRPDE